MTHLVSSPDLAPPRPRRSPEPQNDFATSPGAGGPARGEVRSAQQHEDTTSPRGEVGSENS